MKKILFSSFVFAASILSLNAQNTIPTTTVTGALSVNDSLKVTRDISSSGSIKADGEVISRDTMRAEKDVKVDGSVTIGHKLTVEGNALFKGNVKVKDELIAKDTLRAEKDVIVNGRLTSNGNINTNSGFFIKGSPVINLLPPIGQPATHPIVPPAVGSNPIQLNFGPSIAPASVPVPCVTGEYNPWVPTTNNMGGQVQIYDNTGPGMTFNTGGSILKLISWSTKSSIDASGGIGGGGLLMNYFCGKDISMCQGNMGGVVSMGKNVEMGASTRDLQTLLSMGVPAGAEKAISITSPYIYPANVEIFSVSRKGVTIIGNQKVVSGPHTDAMLQVGGNGKIVCKELRVFTNNWADYVFDKNYKLLSIEEVEKFYKTYNHLPNMPTTEEVIENGNDLTKTDALLLEKIEELTMYIVELKKEINALKDKK